MSATITPTKPPAIDPTPTDPDRTVLVSAGATHLVLHNGVGKWCRGDKISKADFPNGEEGLARLQGLNAVRPLTPDEAKDVPKAEPAKAPAK